MIWNFLADLKATPTGRPGASIIGSRSPNLAAILALGITAVITAAVSLTKVTVNGAVIKPLRGTIEMMVVPIQQGISVIELSEGWTTIRRISALLSGFGVIALLVAAAVLGWHDRWGRPADPTGQSLKGHV